MTERPNIVLILIDDLGWRDLTCYGSDFYETPNLDALADQGMRFTAAYASCPVCSPTGASIMSGKYPARVGVTQYIPGHAVGRLTDVPYFHALPQSEYSLARALRDGGYQTWHVGKWHLGDGATAPHRHGFDVNVAGCGWGMPQHGYFSPYDMPNLDNGPVGEYLTDRLTDEAMALIRERDPDRPFFLHWSHYAVHIPIQSPPELIEKYRRKAADLGLVPEEGLVQGERPGARHLRNVHLLRRTVQSDPAYAAMVENLDTNIGRLLGALDEAGLAEDTLVVFTSDNGGLATSNVREGAPTCPSPRAKAGCTKVARASVSLHAGRATFRRPRCAACPRRVPTSIRHSSPSRGARPARSNTRTGSIPHPSSTAANRPCHATPSSDTTRTTRTRAAAGVERAFGRLEAD